MCSSIPRYCLLHHLPSLISCFSGCCSVFGVVLSCFRLVISFSYLYPITVWVPSLESKDTVPNRGSCKDTYFGFSEKGGLLDGIGQWFMAVGGERRDLAAVLWSSGRTSYGLAMRTWDGGLKRGGVSGLIPCYCQKYLLTVHLHRLKVGA